MAQEAVIERAYTDGRHAAERNTSFDACPFYHDTEEWDAWRSGWIDRYNQLRRLKRDK